MLNLSDGQFKLFRLERHHDEANILSTF